MPRKLSTSMSFGEAVRIATSSLWTHKMRSVLTLLGVVIGVTSVIAVVSLVSGLNRYVAEKVVGLGADVFMINRSPSIITDISQWEARAEAPEIPLRRLSMAVAMPAAAASPWAANWRNAGR